MKADEQARDEIQIDRFEREAPSSGLAMVSCPDILDQKEKERLFVSPHVFHKTFLEKYTSCWNYPTDGTLLRIDPAENGPSGPNIKYFRASERSAEKLIYEYEYWIESDEFGKLVRCGWIGEKTPMAMFQDLKVLLPQILPGDLSPGRKGVRNRSACLTPSPAW